MTLENLPVGQTPPNSSECKRDAERDGDLSVRWKTAPEQRSYTRRLVRALRSAGRTAAPASGVSRSLVIKEAADSALAMTARGRTRWSREILAQRKRRQGRFLWRMNKGVSLRRRAASMDPSPSTSKMRLISAKRKRGEVRDSSGEAVGNQLKVLGRLIPGGEKLAPPTLIEEANDYIAALEMQVKVMASLCDLLSATRC